MSEKRKEEFTFPIGFGSNINLEEKIHILSLMNSCPQCGSRMDIFNRCDYCGYIEFPRHSEIIP